MTLRGGVLWNVIRSKWTCSMSLREMTKEGTSVRFTRQFTLGWMMTISRLGHLGKKKKEGVDEVWYALQCEVRVSYGIRCQVSGLRSQR